MNTFRLPAAALTLSLAVIASAAGASAGTTDTQTVAATTVPATQPANAAKNSYAVALQSNAQTPLRTVGNVNSATSLPYSTANALTPLQMNAAYDRYVLSTLRIDPAIAHTP